MQTNKADALNQITVPSTSGSGTYTIKLAKNGAPAYCNCPSWKFQHKPAAQRSCKHLRAVAEAFAFHMA